MENKLLINNDKILANLMKRETERQYEIQKKQNEKKLINPENEQYNYFIQVFQEKLNQIESWLNEANALQTDRLSQHFSNIWKELHLLQKYVGESLLFLREYDIRICQKTLQDTEMKTRTLEQTLLPKKKFGFRNKRQNQKQQTTTMSDEVDNNNRSSSSSSSSIITSGGGINNCSSSSKLLMKKMEDNNYCGFKNETNKELKLLGDDIFNRDISLKQLTKCLIKLNGSPSTLHISNLTDCVVLCGPVSTSTFLDTCKNCKFVIACQQLRLHNSVDCDLYLHVTSKAIIEDSSRIRVTKYNYVYETIEDDFKNSHLDRNTNNWSKLDDFNWLVADKQSPNWSILSSDDETANTTAVISCKINNWNNFKM